MEKFLDDRPFKSIRNESVNSLCARKATPSSNPAAPHEQFERKNLTEWNVQHGDALGTMLKFEHGSTDSSPDMSERAQDVINRQIVDESEIIVAVLWCRFGTPSGVAQSGTEEEILLRYVSGRIRFTHR